MRTSQRERLQIGFMKRFGFSVGLKYDIDRRMSILQGHKPYEEFRVEIPDSLFIGITRYDALFDVIEGGWLRVKPEIFLDVSTNRIGIRVPFQADLINELKTFIPAGARSWESATKTWYVNPSYIDQVERIVRKHFPDVTITTPGQDLMPVDGDVYTRLLSPLPDFALKAVYRAIALSCHPDRAAANGISVEDAHRLMQQVNLVWNDLKKVKGW